MEIRKIKPEERVIAGLIGTIVFLGKKEENYKDELKDPLKHSDGYEKIWACFNGAGKMEAKMYAHDYEVRYDGHTVGMVGIGGVGTLPEARIGGHIRRIFEKVLPIAREEGKIFSYLYPFSFSFYRKFGYELGYQPNRVSIPTNDFRQYKYPEGMSAYMPGEDISPYAELYAKFISDKNLAMARSAEQMKHRIDHDPYITRKYAYLHRKADGVPDAYILFEPKDGDDDDGNKLKINELIWTTPEALHGIFGFIGGLSPQFSTVEWDAPRCVNAAAMFADSYNVSVSRPMGGMNRVVNVPKAFELINAPLINGGVTIKITDKFMPVNDGTYYIEWENGKVSPCVKTDKRPDMETDVETLSQLVTGFINAEEARHKKETVINGNFETLKNLFAHKDLCLYDYF